MKKELLFNEIKNRIQDEINYYNGILPEIVIGCWNGYIAALIEWDLITINQHQELFNLLPEIPNNPAVQILIGRE